MMSDEVKFLRLKALTKRIQASGNTIWRWTRQGKFPKPIKLGPKTTGWRLDQVETWERDPMNWTRTSKENDR